VNPNPATPYEIISGPPPVLNLKAGTSSTTEGSTESGSFVITPIDLKRNLTVRLEYLGTATNGTDYERLPSTVVIPAKAISIEIRVVPIMDAASEQTETVTLKILPDPAYNIEADGGSATVSIQDSPRFGKIKVRRH
jgi:hypothetical protein